MLYGREMIQKEILDQVEEFEKRYKKSDFGSNGRQYFQRSREIR